MEYIDIDGKVVQKPEGVTSAWRPSVYGVYIKEGRILMCQSKAHAFWELPGGGIEEGESLTEALCREFIEETKLKPLGHSVQPDYVVHRDSLFINGKYYRTILLYFLIESVEAHVDDSLHEESIIATEFIDLQDPPANLHVAHKEAFHYFASKGF